MKLFLQIAIGTWQPGRHTKPLLHFASSLGSDIMGSDLDSQSEPLIADLVIRMLDQSHKVFLFVEANDSNLPLGNAQKVFNYLSKVQEKIAYIVLCGDHRTAENMLSVLSSQFVKEVNIEQVKILIQEFSNIK